MGVVTRDAGKQPALKWQGISRDVHDKIDPVFSRGDSRGMAFCAKNRKGFVKIINSRGRSLMTVCAVMVCAEDNRAHQQAGSQDGYDQCCIHAIFSEYCLLPSLGYSSSFSAQMKAASLLMIPCFTKEIVYPSELQQGIVEHRLSGFFPG